MSDAPKPGTTGLVVRRARTSDVPGIKALVDIYAGKILLEKNLVTLYEAVQEFWVAKAVAKIGASVDTEPSIRPASPG